MKLSPAQVTDLATRCLDSGKVFLTADDALVGWELPDLVESLQRDPANAHVFKTEESESKKSGGDDFQKKYGMSKTEFDKLPARRRLELANAATAAESKR